MTPLWVESLGRTSLVYGFEVTGPRGPAARGRMVWVNIGDRSGAVPADAASPAVAWSEQERAALQTSD